MINMHAKSGRTNVGLSRGGAHGEDATVGPPDTPLNIASLSMYVRDRFFDNIFS